MSLHTAIFLLFLMTVTCSYATNFTNVVNTEYGPVRGKIVELSNGQLVNNYLAFPFAQANRYERPTGPKKWTEVLNATEHGVMCPQFLIPGLPPTMVPSEDCLTVSVYAPASAKEDSNLPVMHWIHGGGYMFGFMSLYDGSFLAADRNVIVVETQYRVGSFGWLSTGTKELPGNYGLFDMLQGLKWTKQNIKKFGGDPDKVTIFGQSAGGMAVATLMLSPLTEGLFKNVIIQSGYANMLLAVMEPTEALESAKALGKNCGCNDMSNLKECLSKQSMTDLVAKQSLIPAREFLAVFSPVVDGDFLPDLPTNLIAKGNFRKTNVIVGFTDDDGGTLLATAPAMFRGLPTDNGTTREDFLKYMNRTSFVRGQNSKVVDAIINEYTDKNDVDNINKTRRSLFELTTDMGFRVPALVASQAFAKKGMNTFVYQFDYRLPLLFDHKSTPAWMGAYHGADLPYTFGTEAPFLSFAAGFGKESKDFGVLFRTYLKNFVATGDPNSNSVAKWPKFVNGEEKVILMHPNPTVTDHLVADKVKFWQETVPSLVTPPKTTAGEKQGPMFTLVVIATSVLVGTFSMLYICRKATSARPA